MASKRRSARATYRKTLHSLSYDPRADIDRYGVHHSYSRTLGHHAQPTIVSAGPVTTNVHAKPGPQNWKHGYKKRSRHRKNATPFVQDQSHLNGVGKVDYHALKTHAEFMAPKIKTVRRSAHPLSRRSDSAGSVMHPQPRYTLFVTSCPHCKKAMQTIKKEGLSDKISICTCDDNTPHVHKSMCKNVRSVPTLKDMYTGETLVVGNASSYSQYV